MIQITSDIVITSIIIAVISGVVQTITSWVVLKKVLNRIDKRSVELEQIRARELETTVEQMHLTPEQKKVVVQSIGKESANFAHEYGNILKDSFFWWRKKEK